MRVRLEGLAYRPQPDDGSDSWRIPDQCTLRLDFDPTRPVAVARLTRMPDGAIRAIAERVGIEVQVVAALTARRYFAVGVICPEDPLHAEVVSVAVVTSNDDPGLPPYQLTVEDATSDEARLLESLLAQPAPRRR